MTSSTTVSDVVAERVKEVRKRRGLTAVQLAERCAAIGVPELTPQSVSNIETGRRDKAGARRRYVTVDELVALAVALEVAPVHLLVPPHPSPRWDGGQHDPNDEAAYRLTPTRTEPSFMVRRFIRGETPLPGMDERAFYSEIPPQEFAPLLGKDDPRGAGL
ncbi:helix-turn-helix domain-containing protein [Streptomyces sp. NPDC059957]|uniref:helix-turn-helix domain-containing protein n=1 Tax=unclassified Streptomyces TaxID=2593676 RepID=UPI003651CE7C